MYCHCDYDLPKWIREQVYTANKQHKCSECRTVIKPGTKYKKIVGMWDGCVDTYRWCAKCSDLHKWVENNVPCVCYEFGNLFETLKDAVIEAQYRAPKETSGLYFEYMRKVVDIKRSKQNV